MSHCLLAFPQLQMCHEQIEVLLCVVWREVAVHAPDALELTNAQVCELQAAVSNLNKQQQHHHEATTK
jgi:hypothetical protein